MTYYVPELGLWHQGRAGRQIAILTGAVAAGANQMLVTRYRHYGVRVADVFAAFRSSDFGLKNGHAPGGPGQVDPAPAGAHRRASSHQAHPASSHETSSHPASSAAQADPVPPNVAMICSLTWMCAPAPRGPNEHPNNAGYRVIARTFWRAIAGSP
jgi:hypothetical protein